MADSKVAKARKRLQSLAVGVTADGLTLAQERIHLGDRAAAEEFAAEGAYVTGEPVLAIGSSSIGFSGSYYPLVVQATLAVPLSGADAQDWANVDNLVAALRAKWLDANGYPSGEVKAKVCDYEAYKADLRGDVTVVSVELFVALENPDA
ncbi:MAG: hypothetical protein NTW87_10135 [Planctomycetota bacterium]|nr:hypothetical protein [Planctomycetota bacterium]